jgi:hypothetical protein
MTQLGKVSRGLDRSHPEFKQQCIDKLTRSLSKAINSVIDLEKEHEEACLRMAVVRTIAIDAISMLEEKQDVKEIISVLVELIETLDGVED